MFANLEFSQLEPESSLDIFEVSIDSDILDQFEQLLKQQ